MPAAILGFVLGVVNVVAAALLYRAYGPDPHRAGFVLAYGLVPGALCGAVVGGIAAAARDRPWLLRFAVLFAIAALVVAGLGTVFGATSFIATALIPTAALTCLLERVTHRHPPRPHHPLHAHHRLSPSTVGMLLGAAVFTIMLIGYDRSSVSFLVGLVIGGAIGAPLGAVADVANEQSPGVRRFVLVALASLVVAVLAAVIETPLAAAAPVLVPTWAACLLLERVSRATSLLPRAAIHAPSAMRV